MRPSQVVTAGVLGWLAFVGCGGLPTEPTPPVQVLLSSTLAIPAGTSCSTGGASANFAPTGGKAVTINAQGSGGVNPAIVLYAPDFATQLATVSGTAGRATMNYTFPQSGSYHITVCDQNGIGGSVTVNITQAR